MTDKRYMNFDEAVTFLSTTRSTLYKWLQAGKVPGHKLGRQWRFLENELDEFRSGTHKSQTLQSSLNKLGKLLSQKAIEKKRDKMNLENKTNTCEVAEQLIWDATEDGAYGIHIQPKNGEYEIAYRNLKNTQVLTNIDKNTFAEINNFFQEVSTPIRGEDKRRFFLAKKLNEGKIDLHIRYQQLETVTGSRITLKINRTDHPANSLKAISSGENLKTFERWCSASHGIIAITGSPYTGKTTTIHCAIQDMLKSGRVIFTMEDPVEFIIEGANQVEVDTSDSKAIEQAFDAIFDSDLDIICLGLSEKAPEETILRSAMQAATSGHLVLLQMYESTSDKAVKKLESILGKDVNDLLVGVSSQKLIKHDGGRKAVYEMIAGNLDQTR